MKTKALIFSMMAVICMIILFAGSVRSQDTIMVRTERAQMSKGIQTAYIVEIPMVTLKDVQQNWIKRLQENIRTKAVKSKDELVLAKVVKSEISSDTISIYTLFIEKADRIVMNVFLQIDTVFFSPKEDKTDLSAEKIDSSIKNYVRKFAVEQYKLAAAEALEAQQKILEQMENDLEKLIKNNENLNKDISTQENDIDKTERTVSDLDKQIDLKNQEILSNTNSMQTLVLDTDKKAAQDKQKTLDKEKNKLEKERTNDKNDISDMKSKIEKDKKGIEDNEKLQEDKQTEIATQKEEVTKAQTMLNGIK
jgi:predicted  nucleic acid-binding Zn-ribbon protein